MSLISPQQAADGQSVNAAAVNNPINTIANDYNGNITNANISPSAAIDVGKLAGGTSGMFGSWLTWAPNWTNLTVGNGTVIARYVQLGKLTEFWVEITFGTTTSISGNVSFSLPATAQAGYGIDHPIGISRMADSGVQGYPGMLYMATTTTVRAVPMNASGTYAADAAMNATTPFAFGASDWMFCSGKYEAA